MEPMGGNRYGQHAFIGAGKSTLLYALSGMDEINAGQVFYRDQEISRMGEKALSRLRALVDSLSK